MTGKVRIIGGQWRGRRLAVPEVPGLRPSGDRAREVLFNWLQPRMHGARCLDLFAGTGALGLEAASRGAALATLVERDQRLVEALRDVAAQWPGGGVLEIVQADAVHWLEHAGGPYDVVFVDPPFGAGLYAHTLQRLSRPDLLADDAAVYVESAVRDPAPFVGDSAAADTEPGADGHWKLEREKQVGQVRLQLLAPAQQYR